MCSVNGYFSTAPFRAVEVFCPKIGFSCKWTLVFFKQAVEKPVDNVDNSCEKPGDRL